MSALRRGLVAALCAAAVTPAALAWTPQDAQWNPATLPIGYRVNASTAPSSIGASGALSAIDGGMASNIRIPRVLARTITVYTNVSAFHKVLGIPGSEEVQACVVTPSGEVLARVPGEPTDAAWEVVSEALGRE